MRRRIEWFLRSRRDRILKRYVPFFLLKRWKGANLLTVLYHMVSDERVPHVFHLYPYKKVNEFIADLDFFCKNFTPVPLEQIIIAIEQDKYLPKNSFLITIDDGFMEGYEIIAPILKKKGIPAAYFLNNDFIDNKNMFYRNKASVLIELTSSGSNSLVNRCLGLLKGYGLEGEGLGNKILSISYKQRDILEQLAAELEFDDQEYLRSAKPYLSSDQIKRLLLDGFAVGAHSMDHPQYHLLTLQEQLRQTTESVGGIVNSFHLGYKAFAFPFSDSGVSNYFFHEIYDTRTVDISFGTNHMFGDPWHRNIQRLWMEMEPLRPAKELVPEILNAKLLRAVNKQDRVVRE